jgi:O-antigen ligase
VVWAEVPQRQRDYLWSLVAILASVALLIAILEGPNSLGRFAPLTMGPNTFGRLVAAAVVVVIFLAIAKNHSNLLLATSTIFLVGIFLSGSLGAVAGLVVTGIAITGIAWRKFDISRTKLGILASAGIVMGLALVSFPSQEIEGSSVGTSTSSGHVISQPSDETARLLLFAHAVDQFSSAPMFGIGLNGFAASFDRTHPDTVFDGESGSYAHNIFLSVAAEGGLIGLAFLLAALALPALPAARRVRMSADLILPFALAIFFLTVSQVSGDYYDSRLLWFYLLLFAGSASTTSGYKKS